jgi:4-hydroxybenzoate polyprenyltransferase
MKNPTLGAKFRALLATGRVANLPTVWSNVIAGFVASHAYLDYSLDDSTPFWGWLLTFLLLSTSMIYTGGCMLGDARDINFDRKHRPNRPLPQGVVSIRFITLTAWSLLLAGLLLISLSLPFSVLAGFDVEWKKLVAAFKSKDILETLQLHVALIATLLVGTVVTYAFTHKKNRLTALPLMASCRLLLVFLAISAAHLSVFDYWSGDAPLLDLTWIRPWMILMAGTIGLYTLLLSWVASTESLPGKFPYRKILAACMLALPAITIILTPLILSTYPAPPYRWDHDNHDLTSVFPPPNIIPHYTFLILALAWIAFSLKSLHPSKPAFVSRALAGFCLLDAALIAPHSPTTAFICLALFGIALLLQKVTPAT